MHVFPRGYNVLRTKQPVLEGENDLVRLVLLDQGGVPVVATFSADAFVEFQAFVADPEGEAARQRAREQILGPGGKAPTLKTKH